MEGGYANERVRHIRPGAPCCFDCRMWRLSKRRLPEYHRLACFSGAGLNASNIAQEPAMITRHALLATCWIIGAASSPFQASAQALSACSKPLWYAEVCAEG